MNKNKLIFAVIWGIILLSIIFIILSLPNKNTKTTTVSSTDMSIWILQDSQSGFKTVIEDFKKIYPKYAQVNINVESFSSYKEYSLALTSAIIQWKTPDIFVLNNRETKPLFLSQISAFDNELFSVNDFRAKYKTVFSDDLIVKIPGEWDEFTEYLKWIPVGYETLGVFFNKAERIQTTDLANITAMNNLIRSLKERKPNIIPLGLWNGATVYNIADIFVQFIMNETVKTSLSEIDSTVIKKVITRYNLYGDDKWENQYNTRFIEMFNFGQNNLDLFSRMEIAMIIGYPRMIEEIHARWYKKNLLFATHFPVNASGEGNTLLNYNYFVLNKDSQNTNIAFDFLQYLMSDNGASNYLDTFPYYLPALLSLEDEKMNQKIHPEYNIILKNFYNNESILSSFDVWVKEIYEREIAEILDNPNDFLTLFEALRTRLHCTAQKLENLENLSASCQ